MQIHLSISENKDYDVIVAGGGPAGCAAAAAASQKGAKTLLIEASGMLGGMGTLGMVPSWTPYSDGKRIIYGGIAKQVFEKTKKQMPHVKSEDVRWVPIHSEVLKQVYDDLLCSSGADVLFHTALCAAHTDDYQKIDYILAAGKDGITAYRAKVFVDTTGDGDLCAFAGAAYDQEDSIQPATHCFTLANVDTYGYLNGPRLHWSNPESPVYRMMEDPELPDITDVHLCDSLIGPGLVAFNAGHIWGVDNTIPGAWEIKGRALAKQFLKGLKKYHSAFGEACIAQTAPHIGVRESRRIRGRYRLTLEDYLQRRSFPDEIGRNCYYIDIHNSQEEIQKIQEEGFVPDNRFEHYQPGESHGIPYGCLVPEYLTNVLVAGRCISTDAIVQGSIRVMPACLVTGEAAGCAAAIAAEEKIGTGQVNIHKLRLCLKERGCYLPDTL